MNPTPDERRFLRDQLRQARAKANLDGEGFAPILNAIEQLGSFAHPTGFGLNEYRDKLLGIAEQAPSLQSLEGQRTLQTPIGMLFDMVRDGRNEAVHEGAQARHFVRNCVGLALLLEEGLMADSRLVADFMVRDPVCAEPWHPVAYARKQMLMNSFSYLPMKIDGKWKLLSDHALARYLPVDKSPRRNALARKIADSCRSTELQLDEPTIVPPDMAATDALKACNGKPVLVVQGENLCGIATAFDFL